MLEKAEKRFAALQCGNVQCMKADVEKLPIEGAFFDVVLSMNGFHVFPDKEKVFDEVIRVLKPQEGSWNIFI